jgi:hypothetical protein
MDSSNGFVKWIRQMDNLTHIKNFIDNDLQLFHLESGDLLFIDNQINNDWKHSILQRKKISTSRISILFFIHN